MSAKAINHDFHARCSRNTQQHTLLLLPGFIPTWSLLAHEPPWSLAASQHPSIPSFLPPSYLPSFLPCSLLSSLFFIYVGLPSVWWAVTIWPCSWTPPFGNISKCSIYTRLYKSHHGGLRKNSAEWLKSHVYCWLSALLFSAKISTYFIRFELFPDLKMKWWLSKTKQHIIMTQNDSSHLPNKSHSQWGKTPFNQQYTTLYGEQFPLLRVSDRKWKTLEVFSLVSDPLQRDTNQVHLAATQRLLAAHHASEQRGRSLQLPRYRPGLTNYHTHTDAISLSACVSDVWSVDEVRDRGEREREEMSHVAPEEFHKSIDASH